MSINFNPNLLPNDAPDDELILKKLGALVLIEPSNFESVEPSKFEPELTEDEESANLDIFFKSLKEVFQEVDD